MRSEVRKVRFGKRGTPPRSGGVPSAAKPNLSNFRGPQPSRSPRHGISDLEPELLYPWRLRIYRLATKQQNDLPAC